MFFRKRVFILGPSHHVRIAGCALSSARKYKTPLYDLTIDTESMSLNIFIYNTIYHCILI